MFMQFPRVFKKGFALRPGPLCRNTGSSRFPIGVLALLSIVFSVASLTLDASSTAKGKTSSSFKADRLHRKLAGSATNLASSAPKIVFGSVRNGDWFAAASRGHGSKWQLRDRWSVRWWELYVQTVTEWVFL
jgi:hypothetical protein